MIAIADQKRATPQVQQQLDLWETKAPAHRRTEPVRIFEERDQEIDFLVRNITKLPRAFWDGCKMDD